jgi:hypothetical protein
MFVCGWVCLPIEALGAAVKRRSKARNVPRGHLHGVWTTDAAPLLPAVPPHPQALEWMRGADHPCGPTGDGSDSSGRSDGGSKGSPASSDADAEQPGAQTTARLRLWALPKE